MLNQEGPGLDAYGSSIPTLKPLKGALSVATPEPL